MNTISGIKNIIFDLGGVLVDLDFIAPVKAFQQLGAPGDFLDYRHAMRDPVFRKMELGWVSPEEFRDQIRIKLQNDSISDKDIDQAWCSILGSVPAEKVSFLQHLKTEYRLFLYSNTNLIHVEYFRKRFFSEHHIHFEELFVKIFYSHEIHDRKPQLSGYEKVISMAGVLPGETLFVDDFAENIAAAREAGLQVIHYIPGTDLTLIVNE